VAKGGRKDKVSQDNLLKESSLSLSLLLSSAMSVVGDDDLEEESWCNGNVFMLVALIIGILCGGVFLLWISMFKFMCIILGIMLSSQNLCSSLQLAKRGGVFLLVDLDVHGFVYRLRLLCALFQMGRSRF
jgi:hypothetical protein